MPLQGFSDLFCNMICKVDRNSIPNHLITHIDIFIKKYVIIRE